MQSFKTTDTLVKWLENKRLSGDKIGFVPTMGALHEGHASLVERAKNECDCVIVSIFVNPTQFNSHDDLDKYPKSLESDMRVLFAKNCDAVFIPEVTTMYPKYPHQTNLISIDLTDVNEVMEGKFRAGHFEGVVNVVYQFFEIIKPHKAYFGEKDFQQLAVIRRMVDVLQLPLEIVTCETVREASGLAMSSRNTRLSTPKKVEALLIYQTLILARKLSQTHLPNEVKKLCLDNLRSGALVTEYLEICDPKNLQPLSKTWVPGARCFIAAFCDDVRLIDNMELIP